MTGLRGRSVFGLTLRLCLGRAVPVALLVGILAPLVARGAAEGPEGSAPAAAVRWFELMQFGAAAAVVVTALCFWPRFASSHPGQDAVIRLQRGPWQGCGAALAGAVLAQALLAGPLALLFALAIGAPNVARAHIEAVPPRHPLLHAAEPRLTFDLPSELTPSAVVLRPLAAPPDGPLRPSRVAVFFGDERLPATATFDRTDLSARLPCPAPARPADAITIELLEGSVPLFFPDGSVVAVSTASHALAANAALAGLFWSLPTFLALAVACLCGAAAARPTVLVAALTVLFLGSIGGLGPAGDAAHRLLRGQWLGTIAGFVETIPFLAAGAAGMIAAMPLRRRTRS